MGHIKLIITDFDGTLVNTFAANYAAYRQSFQDVGLVLSEADYRACFGYRFDDFMAKMGISDRDTQQRIRDLKTLHYPSFFNLLEVNTALLDFIKKFKRAGGKTAVASTARRKNLENALTYIGAADSFDLVLAGEDVVNAKPDPEIYLKVMERLGAKPDETLIFEDAEIGFKAAENAGVSYIKITDRYFL